jgi:hypothetical protein
VCAMNILTNACLAIIALCGLAVLLEHVHHAGWMTGFNACSAIWMK